MEITNKPSFITPAAFKNEVNLQDAEPKYCLLVGNGLDLYFSGYGKSVYERYEQGQSQQWASLLDSIAKRILSSKKFKQYSQVIQKGPTAEINNTERLLFLQTLSNMYSGKIFPQRVPNYPTALQDAVKDLYDVAPEKLREIPCELVKSIWNNGHHILTTNFGWNLEKYLSIPLTKISLPSERTFQSVSQRGKSEKTPVSSSHSTNKLNLFQGMKKSYSWQYFYSDWPSEKFSSMQESIELQHDLWHIHGCLGKKGSITELLFSSLDYFKAISHVNYYGNVFDANWKGRKTWLQLFFECPLLVTGLSLEPQETFLRYLLMMRKAYREHKKLDQEKHRSYYLCSDEFHIGEQPKCRDFLSLLGFEFVRFDTYQQLYNLEG